MITGYVNGLTIQGLDGQIDRDERQLDGQWLYIYQTCRLAVRVS